LSSSGSHVERLEFLDVIFGDRPALSPPEMFYQRMLTRGARPSTRRRRCLRSFLTRTAAGVQEINDEPNFATKPLPV